MKTIILENELYFRYYLLKNINKIIKIYITYDNLDNTIYFYSFIDNDILIATKENINNRYYFLMYQKLFDQYLEITFINKDNIKLLKKELTILI